MPLVIRPTSLTTQFVTFGGGSLYGSGYLLVQSGSFDIKITYGKVTGQSAELEFDNIAAGQYSFFESKNNGIVSIAIRAAGGVLSSPVQTVQGSFFEPGIPSFQPIAAGVTIPSITSLIAQTILGAAAANVSFTVPGTFTHLRVEYLAGCDQASDTTLGLTLNNDAGANYQWQAIQSVNGAASASGAQAQTSMVIGIIGTAANGFYAGTIDIPFYQIGVQKRAVGTFAGTGQSFRVGSAGGGWTNAAIVSTVTLTPGAGNFSTSSAFALYGI